MKPKGQDPRKKDIIKDLWVKNLQCLVAGCQHLWRIYTLEKSAGSLQRRFICRSVGLVPGSSLTSSNSGVGCWWMPAEWHFRWWRLSEAPWWYLIHWAWGGWSIAICACAASRLEFTRGATTNGNLAQEEYPSPWYACRIACWKRRWTDFDLVAALCSR